MPEIVIPRGFTPRELGDVHGVVAIIYCDMETLAFICDELPESDGFTKSLQKERWALVKELEVQDDG